MLNSASLHFSDLLLPTPFPRVSSPSHALQTLTRVSANQRRSSSASPASVVFLLRPLSKIPFPWDFHHAVTPETLTRVSENRAAAESQISTAASTQISTASDVVREFYDGINRRDLASVDPLISEDCIYEDLIFSRPFVGRKAILEFFKKFTESISKELQFVIDDISNEDSLAVGVTWHLEWQGRPFPFSKGCSFYRLEILDGRRQIVYGRDCVEPATKPGEMALVLISGVTWILQRFPQLADRL